MYPMIQQAGDSILLVGLGMHRISPCKYYTEECQYTLSKLSCRKPHGMVSIHGYAHKLRKASSQTHLSTAPIAQSASSSPPTLSPAISTAPKFAASHLPISTGADYTVSSKSLDQKPPTAPYSQEQEYPLTHPTGSLEDPCRSCTHSRICTL